VPIGGKLRALRQQRGLSQGDLENASGLRRCYISRVEHGHTVPSLETLRKFAAALGVPLYQLFHEGADPPPTLHSTHRLSLNELAHKDIAKRAEARFFLDVKALMASMKKSERCRLLALAKRLARRSEKHSRKSRPLMAKSVSG